MAPKKCILIGMKSIMLLLSVALPVAALSAQAEVDVVDMKPLAMKAYGIRSVERKGDRALVVTLGASASQAACARAARARSRRTVADTSPTEAITGVAACGA